MGSYLCGKVVNYFKFINDRNYHHSVTVSNMSEEINCVRAGQRRCIWFRSGNFKLTPGWMPWLSLRCLTKDEINREGPWVWHKFCALIRQHIWCHIYSCLMSTWCWRISVCGCRTCIHYMFQHVDVHSWGICVYGWGKCAYNSGICGWSICVCGRGVYLCMWQGYMFMR